MVNWQLYGIFGVDLHFWSDLQTSSNWFSLPNGRLCIRWYPRHIPTQMACLSYPMTPILLVGKHPCPTSTISSTIVAGCIPIYYHFCWINPHLIFFLFDIPQAFLNLPGARQTRCSGDLGEIGKAIGLLKKHGGVYISMWFYMVL